MVSASKDTVCADCGISSVEILPVRRRYLCRECFVKYVSHKIQKRMGMYRARVQVSDHRRKFLLPLSGGSSSLALLHTVYQQFKKYREKWEGAANELVLVHVTTDNEGEKEKDWRESIQSQYSDCTFLPLSTISNILAFDASIEQDLRGIGLVRGNDESDSVLFARLFASTKTVSAKADLHQILLKRLIITTASEHGCEAILWGHSDSRLAARALADVAKGRGGSIPHDTTDTTTTQGVYFEYPVRDLYKSELKLYLDFQIQDLSAYILEDDSEVTAPVSIKSTSIDSLLTSYITSQGEKYPSIMANVVKTTGKLQAFTASEGNVCKLCLMPAATTRQGNDELCYGCNRMKLDIRI